MTIAVAFQLFETKEYERSKNLYEKLLTDELSAEAEIQLRFGYGYPLSALGLTEKAVENYKKLGELGESTSNQDIVSQAIHQIGMVYRQAGRYEEALGQFEKEQKFIQQYFKDNLLFKAANLYELGYNHLLLNHHEEAYSYLVDSLNTAKKTRDPIMIAAAQRGLGEFYMRNDQDKTAY